MIGASRLEFGLKAEICSLGLEIGPWGGTWALELGFGSRG